MTDPAVTGTVAIGLGLLAASLAAPAVAAARGPAPAVVVRAEGEGVPPGWYGAEAVPGVRRWSAAPADGDRVVVHGGVALVQRAPAEVVWRRKGPEAAGPGAADPGAAGGAGAGRVSLNGASLAELEGLPRVGPVLAARIVAGRPYRSVAELDRVKGIGPATLAVLAPRVTP